MTNITFIPVDYEPFDFQGKNYLRVIGRTKEGKKIALIDSFEPFLYAILKPEYATNADQVVKKIKDLQAGKAGRKTVIEKTKIEDKNFLGNKVKAIKIFVTNYKDAHPIADQLDLEEIDKRREYDINLTTKYIIEKEFNPLIWYDCSVSPISLEEFGGLSQDLEVMCFKLNSHSQSKEQPIFQPKILSFDIESDNLEPGKGSVVMISMCSDTLDKVLTWKKCSIKQDFVECLKSEGQMLERFVEVVKEQDPDILAGYFSDGFDLPYLRAVAAKEKVKLSLGLDGSQPSFSRGRMVSGRISGIVHIDLYRFIATAYAQYLQSETLSLNEVASELLGEKKHNFDFEKLKAMKETDWRDFFQYNLQDSCLALKLAKKIWPDMLQFSQVIQEPLYEITRAGMSQLLENYIIHNLKPYNEIIEKRPIHEDIGNRREREKVEGAFVFTPTPGLYEDLCIFDFTSMHTSIIVSFNISKENLTEKSKNTIESPEVDWEGKKATFHFQQNHGFLPDIVKKLIEKRKEYKKEYKENPNPITKARSNAFKVLSAAVHGYIGFFGARYYSLESSASILAFVRKFNKEVIDKVNAAGFKVVYGDSVAGNTKVIVKKENKVFEEEIKNLFEQTNQTNFGKDYNFKKGVEILTLENGKSAFKPINYIMRHKINKKMFRVWFTNNWYIDVTEDHSLMGYQAMHFNQTNKNKANPLNRIIEIKPEEIRKKANSIISLKRIPYEGTGKNYIKEVYEIMGYFLGDGSFRRNNAQKEANKDYYLGLSLGKDKEEIIKKLINPLQASGHIKSYWESKSRDGDVTINGLKLINLIGNEMRSKEGKKCIPEWLFDEKEENIASFLRGFFSADGCVMIRNSSPIIKCTSIDKEVIDSVRKLLYRAGVSHSIFKENSVNKYKSKNKIYSSGSHSINLIIQEKDIFSKKVGFLLDRKNERLRLRKDSNKKKSIKNYDFDLQGVVKVEEIPCGDYVYDAEVEDTHTFFANNVLVHNTDSVAFLTNNKPRTQVLEFLKKLNSELPGIMELELEDFYKRGIWVTKRTGEFGAKKKYALINEEGKMKIRGFETVRRDWCTLARELQSKVLNLILKNGNEKQALDLIKQTIQKIKERKIDKKQIMIRTQLKKPLNEYLSVTPHVIAARKMEEQGLPIKMGILIEYFIAETREKKSLVREKVKLPDEKGEYNIEYYLNNQILPAVENILEVFNINIKEVIDGNRQKKLF